MSGLVLKPQWRAEHRWPTWYLDAVSNAEVMRCDFFFSMSLALISVAFPSWLTRSGVTSPLGFVPETVGDAKGEQEEGKGLRLTIGYDKEMVKTGDPFSFSCELKNETGKPIVIKWRLDKLLEFVTFEGEGPEGKGKVSAVAHRSPPPTDGKQHVFILEPGKSLKSANVFPKGNTAKPGVRRCKAYFEYCDPDSPDSPPPRAESNVTQFKVVEAD